MRLRHTTPVATDAALESVRVFDRSGRFVARVTLAELARTVAERRLDDGWVLVDGDDLWRPVGVGVARVGEDQPRRSGVYVRGETGAIRKAG